MYLTCSIHFRYGFRGLKMEVTCCSKVLCVNGSVALVLDAEEAYQAELKGADTFHTGREHELKRCGVESVWYYP